MLSVRTHLVRPQLSLDYLIIAQYEPLRSKPYLLLVSLGCSKAGTPIVVGIPKSIQRL